MDVARRNGAAARTSVRVRTVAGGKFRRALSPRPLELGRSIDELDGDEYSKLGDLSPGVFQPNLLFLSIICIFPPPD